MFDLYAFDWSPRLLSIRASESPAVQKNLLEKTRRPRLEELEWIHSVESVTGVDAQSLVNGS